MVTISNIFNSGDVVINGSAFCGQEVELRPFVDGKEVEGGNFSGSIKIEVKGDCGDIKTMSGDVDVTGRCKDIKTMSGDVTVGGKPEGKIRTMSGDITIK